MSQELNNKMIELMGVDQLHALGYKGNGVKIMILDNLSDPENHGVIVRDSLLVSSPNCNVVLLDNDESAWVKAVNEKYDIVHISMTAFSQELSKIFVNGGGIVTACSGNKGMTDNQCKFRYWDWVIDIGACRLDTDGSVKFDAVTKINEDMDLTCFTPMRQATNGTWFQPLGTSFSSPMASGAIACLLEHFKHIGYKYTPQSVKQYLIDHAVDILSVGKDNQSGYGYVKVGLMNTIKATIGQNSLVVNGMVKPIPQGAVLVNGNTMVPFRAIGDAIESVIKDKTVLSYKTDWDPTTRTAIYFIDTK